MKLVEQTGVSYGYIRELINGQRKPEKMSLDIFSRLFPDANLTLHGNHTQSIGDNSNGNIQQIGANVVTNVKRDDIRDYQLKVLQAIIGLELDAKAKDAVLTAINQVK
jgi:hypothetical protein